MPELILDYPQLFEEKKVLSRRIYGLQKLIDREVLLSGDVVRISASSRRAILTE
jgi:hypothetical protein